MKGTITTDRNHMQRWDLRSISLGLYQYEFELPVGAVVINYEILNEDEPVITYVVPVETDKEE